MALCADRPPPRQRRQGASATRGPLPSSGVAAPPVRASGFSVELADLATSVLRWRGASANGH
eukprot:7169258-Alexandrium_andersonii.AAC.1